MTAIRSDIASASSWSCVTYTNVMPTSRWIRLSSTCICLRSFRSSAPSGSSSSSTDGRLTSARASATRWRWPPESSPGRGGRALVERDQLERLRHALLDLRLRRPCAAQPEGDVLAHVEMLEQRVGLEHRVDVAAIRRDLGDVLAVEADRARRSAARSPRSAAASSSCRSPTGRAARRTRRCAILQRHLVDRGEAAEALRHALELDRQSPVPADARRVIVLLPVSTARPLSRRPSRRGSTTASR